MGRITTTQLKAVIGRINKQTKSPEKPYVDHVAQIGSYHLSAAYGGYSLHRIVSADGGISDVLNCGHVSKRDLFKMLLAYIEGLNDGAGIVYGERRS